MKIGDEVRIAKIPPKLPDNELDTKRLFELCLGRVFPIVGFQDKLIELHVGGVVGEPDYLHSIWIEPEFVELVKSAK